MKTQINWIICDRDSSNSGYLAISSWWGQARWESTAAEVGESAPNCTRVGPQLLHGRKWRKDRRLFHDCIELCLLMCVYSAHGFHEVQIIIGLQSVCIDYWAFRGYGHICSHFCFNCISSHIVHVYMYILHVHVHVL